MKLTYVGNSQPPFFTPDRLDHIACPSPDSHSIRIEDRNGVAICGRVMDDVDAPLDTYNLENWEYQNVSK